MSHISVINHKTDAAVVRPCVTSYDSGYEHSIEHWVEVRQMVEDFEEKVTLAEEPELAAA